METQNNEGPFVEYDSDGDKKYNVAPLTILEKQEAEQAKRNQKDNMIKKQPGFKGERAFIAEPAEISFKNFSLGKLHVCSIVLTNVSNAFNSFNVLPLPEKIRNYFEVEYTPMGKMSPGIKCKITFKFLPQLNEDIHSEFTIVAETGKITYPIVCTSKKTIVRCDNPLVNFNQIIYGESGKAKLTIRNEGTLPSEYVIKNINGSDLGKTNSEEQLKFIDNLQFQKKGEINGMTDHSIHFEFKPAEIGFFELTFLLQIKNILHSPPIRIDLQAQCVEVPVRIERNLYDFEVCLLNHIYREKLTFYNKGQTPISFKMVQPNETRKYFQFNPVIGYIQKQSKIDIWIKFTAEKDLTVYLSKYIVEKDVFQIPFHMAIKQQVLPATFEVKFKITSQKLIIRPSQLNFGKIFQGLSSKIQVQFENQSQLPQQILLYPLKKQISVENDQTLLKILPKQTIKTYITYKSKNLQDNGKSLKDDDHIPCKIMIGSIATAKVDLHYTCEIIKPDLCILNKKIDLAVLQVDQMTMVSTTFKNNVNKDILFQIFVPFFEICGLKVTPVVCHLKPKQEVQIHIQYHSSFKKLTPALIKQAQLKNVTKNQPIEEKKEVEPVIEKKQANKKDAKKQTKLTKQQQEQVELEQKKLEEEERLRKEREEEQRLQQEKDFNAEVELSKIGGKFYDFGNTQHYKWLLPVYFKQKDYSDVSAEVNYIEVTTTSTEKVLVGDKSQIDFGQIAVGTRSIREIVIVNRGETAELKKKNIPVFCSFHVLNSMKFVETDKPFKAVVEFQPIEEQRFEQKLQFYTDKYSVSCVLKGKGVRPEVTIEPESGLVNMGGVMLDEYSQKSIKIKNICNFEINFLLEKVGSGVNNSNSSRAISYIPSYGVIKPNSVIEIKIKFKPDRVSEKYFEKIKVHVEQQKEIKYFYVSGACYPRQAYIVDHKENKIPLDQEVKKKVQSSFDWLKIKDQSLIYGPNNKTIVLTFTKITEQMKEQKCFKRKLVVGSCKLLDNKLEKPTNFQIIMPKDDRFQCDNLKGTVNAGTETVVTFTFKPEQADALISKIPILMGVGQWKDIKVELKYSGGLVKAGGVDALSLDVILRVYINQL